MAPPLHLPTFFKTATLLSKRQLGGPNMNLDFRTAIWSVAVIIYTLITGYGLYRVYRIRHTLAVRLRGFYFILASVVTLQCYGILIFLAYIINGHYPCGVEFWIMNTLLPYGMALFQVLNARFYYTYVSQQQLISPSKPQSFSLLYRLRTVGIWRTWPVLKPFERLCVGVVVFAIVQFIIAIVLFAGGRHYHPSFGFFGNPHADELQCRRGVDWVPSVAWQFIWSWIIGPYYLFKARGIRDTHYWRVQTASSILACLPGTPMWLAFLYVRSSATVKVQEWLIPAFWFLPGMLVMQWSPIICTLLDARLTLQRRASFSSEKSVDSAMTTRSGSSVNTKYSMSFLEMTLENSIESFLTWVAAHDFTAECVLFLMRVRNFRRNWQNKALRGAISNADLRDLYIEAAAIFYELVEPQTSDIPVNLSGRIIADLREHFKGLEYRCSRDSTSSLHGVLTFDEYPSSRNSQDTTKASSSVKSSTVTAVSETAILTDKESQSNVRIPVGFNATVFDRAYDSVKDDVYRGAWPLYQDKFGRLNSNSGW